MGSAFDPALQKARVLKQPQVLRYRWQRHIVGLRKLTHGGFALAKLLNQSPAGGVRQGKENHVEHANARVAR